MEGRGFSRDEATEVAMQIFNWGFRAAIDRLRPSRPAPSDLPSLPLPEGQGGLFEQPAPPKPAKAKREPSKALHRIPEDYALTEDMRGFASERGFAPKAIEGMWQKFFNHYRGNGQTAVDWKAKWRTWVMKTVEFNTRDGISPNGGRADGNFL